MPTSFPLAIIDAGFGNLFSLSMALRRLGAEPVISREPHILANAERLILPGVGAFGDACDELDARGLRAPIREFVASGRPFLGVCLGMQLLLDSSEEAPGKAGLGLVPGEVLRFSFAGEQAALKVPHMGWNQVDWTQHEGLTAGLADGDYYYFVHSYYCRPQAEADVLGWCDYGQPFAAALRRGNIHGVQFHPEKSQDAGARLLGNFLRV